MKNPFLKALIDLGNLVNEACDDVSDVNNLLDISGKCVSLKAELNSYVNSNGLLKNANHSQVFLEFCVKAKARLTAIDTKIFEIQTRQMNIRETKAAYQQAQLAATQQSPKNTKTSSRFDSPEEQKVEQGVAVIEKLLSGRPASVTGDTGLDTLLGYFEEKLLGATAQNSSLPSRDAERAVNEVKAKSSDIPQHWNHNPLWNWLNRPNRPQLAIFREQVIAQYHKVIQNRTADGQQISLTEPSFFSGQLIRVASAQQTRLTNDSHTTRKLAAFQAFCVAYLKDPTPDRLSLLKNRLQKDLTDNKALYDPGSIFQVNTGLYGQIVGNNSFLSQPAASKSSRSLSGAAGNIGFLGHSQTPSGYSTPVRRTTTTAPASPS